MLGIVIVVRLVDGKGLLHPEGDKMASDRQIEHISGIGHFVKVSDTRIGVVVGNQHSGGVYRGHCNVWFGGFVGDDTPQIEHLCIMDDWKVVVTPVGGN